MRIGWAGVDPFSVVGGAYDGKDAGQPARLDDGRRSLPTALGDTALGNDCAAPSLSEQGPMLSSQSAGIDEGAQIKARCRFPSSLSLTVASGKRLGVGVLARRGLTGSEGRLSGKLAGQTGTPGVRLAPLFEPQPRAALALLWCNRNSGAPKKLAGRSDEKHRRKPAAQAGRATILLRHWAKKGPAIVRLAQTPSGLLGAT